MKQTIRFSTFETNSSSYHTLTIRKVKPIIEENTAGNDLIIENVNQGNYNRTWEFNTPVTKLKSLLNFLARHIEDQAEELFRKNDPRYRQSKSHTEKRLNPNYDQNKTGYYYEQYHNYHVTDDEGFCFYNLDAEERQKSFNNTPIVKTLTKLIKDKLNKNLILKYNGIDSFYSDCFDQYMTDLKKGSKIEDFEKEEFLYNLFEDILFNNEVILEHECETNEEGY